VSLLNASPLGWLVRTSVTGFAPLKHGLDCRALALAAGNLPLKGQTIDLGDFDFDEPLKFAKFGFDACHHLRRYGHRLRRGRSIGEGYGTD
jgi:hypothetical protein